MEKSTMKYCPLILISLLTPALLGTNLSAAMVDVDEDGVHQPDDIDDNNPFVCMDSDGDGCDDCSSGMFNPLSDGSIHSRPTPGSVVAVSSMTPMVMAVRIA
jgi:hypothetical protein